MDTYVSTHMMVKGEEAFVDGIIEYDKVVEGKRCVINATRVNNIMAEFGEEGIPLTEYELIKAEDELIKAFFEEMGI